MTGERARVVELKVQKTSGCELAVPNVEKRSKRRLARSHAGISYRRRGIENILASTGGLVGLLPLVGNKAKIQPSRFIKKVGKKKTNCADTLIQEIWSITAELLTRSNRPLF
jgi:hypothetical protein